MSVRQAVNDSDLGESAAQRHLRLGQAASALSPGEPIKALIAWPVAATRSLERALTELREKPDLARSINDQLSADRAR